MILIPAIAIGIHIGDTNPQAGAVGNHVRSLRITRRHGGLETRLYLYWKPDTLHPRIRPTGADILCRDGVCVRPIGVNGQRDWEDVVRGLAMDACGQRAPGFCADCDHVWIKTRIFDTYRGQSCNVPEPENPAGTMLRFMKAAVDASLRQQDRMVPRSRDSGSADKRFSASFRGYPTPATTTLARLPLGLLHLEVPARRRL